MPLLRNAFAGAAMLAATSAGAVEVREAHYVMGTFLEITVHAPSIAIGRSWLRRGVSEARRLDRELTSYDAESALSRLNHHAGNGVRRVPPDLFRVVTTSKRLSRATNGAFDVSVGPLVQLWKTAARDDRWPTSHELAASRSKVGYEKIRLRPPDGIELSDGMSLELGGIGKGYAADRVAEMMRSLGAEAFLVSFGESSMVAVGTPPAKSGWPVWVRRGREMEGPLFLRGGLSTSRSFGRSKRIAGRRVGHILDPRLGAPLCVDRQATVMAPTATEAEAWSKALLVDPERGKESCNRRGFACLLFAEASREAGDSRITAGWGGNSR
jgi:thiamine biosynthesis lipoprotein